MQEARRKRDALREVYDHYEGWVTGGGRQLDVSVVLTLYCLDRYNASHPIYIASCNRDKMNARVIGSPTVRL